MQYLLQYSKYKWAFSLTVLFDFVFILYEKSVSNFLDCDESIVIITEQ